MKNTEDLSIRDLLEKTGRAELIDFLVDYAECDAHFKNKDEQENTATFTKQRCFTLKMRSIFICLLVIRRFYVVCGFVVMSTRITHMIP